MSPSRDDGARIDGGAIVFERTPVLLPQWRDGPTDSAAMRIISAHKGKDVRDLAGEKHFYASATEVLPVFAEQVCEPGGDVTAEALFGSVAASTVLWQLPMSCKPELHVRSVGGGVRGFHPGWNGEVKSADTNTAIDQAVIYTVMDMVRVFFPTGSPRRFFSSPPVGFALVAYPHVGYLLAIEWVGRVFVSFASDAFFLGSMGHKKAVAALPDWTYDEPYVLDADDLDPNNWLAPPLGDPIADCVSWRCTSGRFQKLLRYDAYPPARLATMARVYRRLQELHHSELEPPPAVVTDVKLLYGAHELLVDMLQVPGVECKPEALEDQAGHVVMAVARAIVWLATQGVIYTDVREPNILVADDSVHLVDYDDCLLEDPPVRTFDGFMGVLTRHMQASAEGTGVRAAGAVRALVSGSSLVELKHALQQAFSVLPSEPG